MKDDTADGSRIAVIGAGAAGLMAAGAVREAGKVPVLFESKTKPARKLGITGKGRCNVTNNCSPDEFIANVPRNPRFLYAAINALPPADTIALFERLGSPLKTERGNRVFPMSDRASDIIHALLKYADCDIIYERVTDINFVNGKVSSVSTKYRDYPFDAVIICTGGLSYPATGSTGDGYNFARAAGHEITPLKPSLVPFEVAEHWCAELQGLSLRNVAVKITEAGGKTVYFDFGELIFTHFGLSGPLILSASSHMDSSGDYKIAIDMKPALDEAALDKRVLSDFNENSNKNFANSLGALLPIKMIPVIIKLSDIDPYKKVNVITRAERKRLVELIKGLPLTFTRFRPIDEAVITSGGVCVKEIDPKTMQSKKVNGLYFAGEVIDVDAYTGGFNLQIAFSTAYLAAKSAAASI